MPFQTEKYITTILDIYSTENAPNTGDNAKLFVEKADGGEITS